jgi:acetyl esterase/lipase
MKRQCSRLVRVLLALCATLAAVEAADPRFEQYSCRTGIVYKTAEGVSLDLAVFSPPEKRYEKTPLMVFIHGGGWAKLDKTVVFNPLFRGTLDRLLQNGFACAAIEYRLRGQGGCTVYDCVVDCKDALRFLVKHAEEYGFDPERVGVWGGSAGGHLSLMTALAPHDLFPGDPRLNGVNPQLRCVAAYFPATTLVVPEVLAGSVFEKQTLFPSFLGGPYEEKKELARKLSPAEYLNSHSPPVLLLHGDQDEILPLQNSVYMLELAAERNADVELVTVTNGMHGFRGKDIRPSMPEIQRTAAEFMIRSVVEP